MADILLFSKSPLTPSIRLHPSDIPVLMHCLDVSYYSDLDLMDIHETELDMLRDKLIAPLDSTTPDLLAPEPLVLASISTGLSVLKLN